MVERTLELTFYGGAQALFGECAKGDTSEAVGRTGPNDKRGEGGVAQAWCGKRV